MSKPITLDLTRQEADLLRQWFNAYQDLNGGALEADDYRLADRIYVALGLATPVKGSARHPRPS